MKPEEEKLYIEAGRIAAQTLEFGKKLIVQGASVLEVSEEIEEKIRELGGVPAFPIQISINNVAAHNCSEHDDLAIFEKGDVCKLDVGVHLDGYVADTATTVYLGEDENVKKLVLASKNALEAAIPLATPGRKISEIGKAIQEEITSLGFSPIKNLSGHGVGKYIIHGPPQIPNYETGNDVLKEGMVIAIEPFASAGCGMIHETDTASIFMVAGKKPVRSQITKEVLNEIKTYNNLPFTTRWLTKKFPLYKVRLALKELLLLEIIRSFSPLPVKDGLVSQAEHTVIVKEKPLVTTLLD